MILVTGATGFLGHHLLQELVQKNIPIRAIHRGNFPSYITPFLKYNIDWQYCDLLDIDQVQDAMQGITQVYHCAAVVSFHSKDAAAMHHFNIESTANIINACLTNKVQKIVHVSSVAALARSENQQLINEKTPWLQTNTTSQYGISKYNSEMEVWRGFGEGLKVIVVNPGIILGESKISEGAMRLLQNAQNEFPFYTTGINAFVDVKDVVKAMQWLMDSDVENEKFILSAGNFSYQYVFTSMANSLQKKPPHKKAGALLSNMVWRYYAIVEKLTGKKPLITKETAHSAQSQYLYDNSKLLQQFPSFKYTPIEETIERITKYFVENNR